MLAHVTSPLAVLAAAALHAAPAAQAQCVYEMGVVVVPASVLGAAGDYILDTGAARTLMHETRAQGSGFADTSLAGEVRLGGLALAGRPVQVADLDARTAHFPTPVAGVIGADVLSAYVLDVDFAPCRVRLWRRGTAPPFPAEVRLPMSLRGGAPVIRAAVSDGPSARAGDFVVATGADRGAAISDAAASAAGIDRPEDAYAYGARRPRLRALSLGGRLQENPTSALVKAAELPDGALGVLGAPALSGWRLRLDFPRGRLELAPTKKAPDMPGPSKD